MNEALVDRAARDRRIEALAEAITDYEAEFGEITDEEMTAIQRADLGRTRQADVIDAAVVLLANDGDEIVTSDRDDLDPMAEATGRHIELIRP
jgi:hypothetical protein